VFTEKISPTDLKSNVSRMNKD